MSPLSGTKLSSWEIVAPIGAAPPLAPATFPQIQALRGSNPRSDYRFTVASALVDNRHVVFRLSYSYTRLVGTFFWLDATRVGNKLERVNERIRRNSIAAVSALELRLLCTLQSRFVQQRWATRCTADSIVPSLRIPSTTVTAPVICATREIGGYTAGDNLVTRTSARLAPVRGDSCAEELVMNADSTESSAKIDSSQRHLIWQILYLMKR